MSTIFQKKLSFKESGIILIVAIVVCGLFFYSGFRAGYEGLSLPWKRNRKNIAEIKRVYTLIEREFSGEFDIDHSISNVIEDIIEGLNDPYSRYLDKEEYEAVRLEDNGTFGGIGIIYTVENSKVVIVEVLPNSPAEKVGIEKGEVIAKINGADVTVSPQTDEVHTLLRGEIGEKVALVIIGPSGKSREVPVIREQFALPSLSFKLIDSTVGYLKVYNFNGQMKEELTTVSEQIREKQVKSLIVDIRNNLGGEVESALFLADQFIKQGVLIQEYTKRDSRPRMFYASSEAPFSNMNLVVLVNELTASAAEIFATAIQGNERGILVGEQTHGKTSEQRVFELSDGSAIQLTTGYWVTLKGERLDGKGVTPDYVVVEEVGSESDAVLQKAIDAVSNR